MFSNVTNPKMKKEVEVNILKRPQSQFSSAQHFIQLFPLMKVVRTDYITAHTGVLKHINILLISVHSVGCLPEVG